jgi:hypothetical protein
VSEDALSEIIAEAKSHTGAKTVTAETRLHADLGMTGDDAERFLQAFAIKYDVDMSALEWQRYFENEPTMADMLMPALVFGASVLSPTFAVRWQSAREAEREITIAHLAEVASTKVWREPDAGFRRAPKANALTLIFSALALLTMGLFVAIGIAVLYAFFTGALGERRVLVLVGIAATGIVLPIYLAYASWRQISAKLASAEG